MRTPSEGERLTELLGGLIGLAFPASRRSHLEHAVRLAVREAGVGDEAALCRMLEDPAGRSEALAALVPPLTVGETYFFRNRSQFQALEDVVLPTLLERRARDRRLQIWSAGCSTGEEAYSVAMTLTRLLPDIDAWDVTILGTDVDHLAVERARRGVYGRWSFRATSPEELARYLRPRGDRHEVVPELRRMVTFARHNLLDPPPAAAFGTDLILCRNVLMYLEPGAMERVLGHVELAAAEEGWLLLGDAETLPPDTEGFEAHHLQGCVAYRKRSRFAPPIPVAPGAPVEPAVPAVAEEIPPIARPDRAVTPGELEPRPEREPARAAYHEARDHLGRLRLEEAESLARAAAEHDPSFAPGHYVLGLVLLEHGRIAEALEALRRAVYIDPGFALAHLALADAHARSGNVARERHELDVLERLLDTADGQEPVAEGEGLTVEQLRTLVEVRRELTETSRPRREAAHA